jgi:hypothetical protein
MTQAQAHAVLAAAHRQFERNNCSFQQMLRLINAADLFVEEQPTEEMGS